MIVTRVLDFNLKVGKKSKKNSNDRNKKIQEKKKKDNVPANYFCSQLYIKVIHRHTYNYYIE